MIQFISTLNNHTYTFTGSDMENITVSSENIAFVAGDVLHVDVDMDDTPDSSMQFSITAPYTEVITDGYRGKYTLTADDYTSLSGQCVIQFLFDDAVAIPTSYVTVYVSRLADSQTQPDWIGGGVAELTGYIGEDVYVHNDDSQDRVNLYNDQKTSEVKVVSNVNAPLVKVFDSIALKSNKSWDVPTVEIQPSATYPNGMQSKIKENKFKLREGEFYSDYFRNALTKITNSGNVTVPVFSNLNLLKGEQLRGHAIENTLVNDDTTEVNLFSVTINSSKSK